MFEQASLFSAFLQDDSTTDTATTSEAHVLKQSLDEAIFVVLDLETTGLNPQRNAITEVTAIKYQHGQEIDKLSTLVQPKEPIPTEVEDLTGITNDMVKNAPPLLMVMNDLLSFMGSTPIIVGHNVTFDLAFLQAKARECGFGTSDERLAYHRALCTKVLAQKQLPGLPSYEGMVVATQLGYHNPNPHRAEADVRMSAAILFALIERLHTAGTLNSSTVEALLDYQGRLQAR
jgi:DNA polymerase III epsilon subunit-like protein